MKHNFHCNRVNKLFLKVLTRTGTLESTGLESSNFHKFIFYIVINTLFADVFSLEISTIFTFLFITKESETEHLPHCPLVKKKKQTPKNPNQNKEEHNTEKSPVCFVSASSTLSKPPFPTVIPRAKPSPSDNKCAAKGC